MGCTLLYYITKPGNNLDEFSENLIPKIIGESFQSNKPTNILILGGDEAANNTDTMMVVNFNPQTAKTSILSIPRDTKVTIKGRNWKINAAYPIGKGPLACSVVSRLLNTEVSHYVFIDIELFKEIIDLLGGVDYYVPTDMYFYTGGRLKIDLKKGYQHLDGDKAEQLVRFRKSNSGVVNKYYDGSDLKRIDAQQNFVREVIRQKAKISYISKADDILKVVFKRVKTDLTTNEILKLLSNIDKLDYKDIEMFKLPGYSEYQGGISYYIADKARFKDIVKEHFSVNK